MILDKLIFLFQCDSKITTKAEIGWCLLLISFLPCQVLAQDCCADSNCKQAAQDLAVKVNGVFSVLAENPGSFEARESILDSVRAYNTTLYNRVIGSIKKLDKWSGQSGSKRLCFFDLLEQEDTVSIESKLGWIEHIEKRLDDTKFNSPEFCREFGLHLDLNQGAQDLFKDSEAYLLSTRVLFSYTFSGKDNCGGRLRFMLGPSLYYSKKKADLFVNPRAEIRLMDIGNPLTNVGNVKLIAQANVGNRFIGGIGLGVELANFGVQILGEYHDKMADYSLQIGLSYRAKLSKN